LGFSGSGLSGIDSTSVAFVLCPRLNAAGRLAHPGKAVELLLCENYELASAKAEELNSLNTQRIEEERAIFGEIEALFEKDSSQLNERILILSGKDWHHGIVGIICSKMVARFGKPCAVISTDGDTAKGSFRSVKGFSVVSALKYCGDLLVNFGGHAGAGGLSVKDENISAFKERLLEYAKIHHESMPVPEVVADLCPDSHDITVENIENLDALQPFGEGNPVPVFYLPKCLIKNKRSLKDGKYVSFMVDYRGRELKILDFYRRYADFWYSSGDTVDLMVTFDINEYNGNRDISIKVVDIRLTGINQDKYFAAKNVYEKIKDDNPQEIDQKLYSRIIPDDSQIKATYDIIKNSFCLDEVLQKGQKSGINYCMLRVIIDIFEEMGLVQLNPATGSLKTCKTNRKADLEKSKVLTNLRKYYEQYN
jgi:single-stranded-DNA-specific exonuclease